MAGLGRLSIAGGLRAQGAVVAALLGGVFRLCCLITLAVFGFPNAVVTYQLTAARSDESRLLVGRDSARKWSQAAWAPGATLIWHIAGSDPDWDTEWFGSAAGFAPVFEEALATWSEVSTADISWVLEGVEHFDEEDGENSRARNFVAIDATADLRGYASYWEHRGTSGEWERDACSVWLGRWAAQPPPDSRLDRGEDELLQDHVPLLVHELGHCLGLLHTQGPPGNRYVQQPDGLDGWQLDGGLWTESIPSMTVGVYGPYWRAYGPKLDDRVGASLLRPGEGWVGSTGSISGRIHYQGQPVALAYVWAYRNAEPISSGVGVFTDYDGSFLIEGLRPGDYVLWVSPLTEKRAHPRLLRRVPVEEIFFDLDETVAPHPVLVLAGRVTDVPAIAVRRGRNCRPPVRCDNP